MHRLSAVEMRPRLLSEIRCAHCMQRSELAAIPIITIPTGESFRLCSRVCLSCRVDVRLAELLTPATYGGIMAQIFDTYGLGEAAKWEHWTLGFAVEKPCDDIA